MWMIFIVKLKLKYIIEIIVSNFILSMAWMLLSLCRLLECFLYICCLVYCYELLLDTRDHQINLLLPMALQHHQCSYPFYLKSKSYNWYIIFFPRNVWESKDYQFGSDPIREDIEVYSKFYHFCRQLNGNHVCFNLLISIKKKKEPP